MMLSVVAVGDAQCHGQGCRLAGVAGWVTVQSAGAMDLLQHKFLHSLHHPTSGGAATTAAVGHAQLSSVVVCTPGTRSVL